MKSGTFSWDDELLEKSAENAGEVRAGELKSEWPISDWVGGSRLLPLRSLKLANFGQISRNESMG